ncbi:RNA 2'-phosphotransferase, Tpt1 [Zychaea mexicana]|uniref:RNA 2'-phosphotransferase, Tpt1 n=1 Tax=Zychaea mexicana TaxID=64656 RepID=UPI0022FEBE40|nr:RNA 2'-phosphotransferase, Tpt1 [Zychaea mexicana]KAI9477068.1 RNA 2'-phosphotransferase, Tpt1 [Zychaea mexicana]
MDPHETIKLSKLLSYILRHGAAKHKLVMRPDGYIPLSDILALAKFKSYTREQIEHVVQKNDKQRFAMAEIDNVWMIRANQGHTVKGVDQEELLERITDTLPVVVHGTSLDSWQQIRQQGLSRMERHHIHCATGLPGESGVISGMRSTSQVYIYIDMSKAMEDGIAFFRSANNVILTEGQDGILLTKYFSKVVDRQGKSLFIDIQ